MVSLRYPWALLLCALSACAHSGREDRWETRTQVIMAVPITVSLPARHSPMFQSTFAVFQEVDRTLSSYREDSEISSLNRAKHARVSRDTFAVLQRSVEMAAQTDGLFDPTMGALTLKTYGFGTSHAKVASPEEIARARKYVDYRKIVLSQTADGGEIRIGANSWLDLGGIGKGFAVDLAAAHLKRNGTEKAVLAASGDIRCLQPCSVAIQHPFRPNAELLSFRSQKEIAISTSGSYERKIGTSTHHLIEPRAGLSSRTFVSVTLLADTDNTTLDALATAIAVADEPQAKKLLAKFPHVAFLLVTYGKKILIAQRFLELAGHPWWSEDKADFKITTVAQSQNN